MKLHLDSPQPRSIQQVRDWYQFQSEILGRERVRVFKVFKETPARLEGHFIDMDHKDIEAIFERQEIELELLTMLALMAAAEAKLYLDYYTRTEKRPKDAISRRFRKIEKQLAAKKSGERPGLEDHILETWITLHSLARKPVRDFKDALKLRHWLAHGRHWSPRLARPDYNALDIYDIAENLLKVLEN